MAVVKPFCGIRYDSSVTGDLTKVVSPPYDVIDANMQDELYNASEYGIVRIDYGKVQEGDAPGKDRYSRARATMDKWLAEGALKMDDAPSFYYVEEDYEGEFGGKGTRTGFLGAVRVETAESGVYRPHEKTLAGPKADRLNLTRACEANLSPVFSLYDDPSCAIDKAFEAWRAKAGTPDAVVTRPDGYDIRMWRVTADAVATVVADVMGDKAFFIADGHHRYETALNYRKEMAEANPGCTGDEPWNFTLMYLVNMHSPGLTVLPTHRAVFNVDGFSRDRFIEKLSTDFAVTEVEEGLDALLEQMKSARGERHVFGGLVKGGAPFLIEPKKGLDMDKVLSDKQPSLRTLDVTILHSLIAEKLLGIDDKALEEQSNLFYVKDAKLLADKVDEGEAQLGLLMNPTPVLKVKEVAETGVRMPQKSTYFYPKLVTGLVINPLGC